MEKKTEAAAADLLLRACCTLRASERAMVAAKREAGEVGKARAVDRYYQVKRKWQVSADAYIALANPP